MTNQVRVNASSNLGLGALYSSSDHRYNLFEVDVPDIVKQQAKAVACLIKRDELHRISEGVYKFKKPSTLADYHEFPLAEDLKFRNEPVIGFGTAFLVAPNLVLTAAHCITDKYGKLDKDLISKTRLVFNLQLKPSGRLPSFLDEVFRYNSHNILWSDRNKNEDWALLELDREVKGVTPIEIDFSPIQPKSEVYMLGHPTVLL